MSDGATVSQPIRVYIQYMHVLNCTRDWMARNLGRARDRAGLEMGVDEMSRLVRSLWAVAKDEDEEAQLALAWLARNQICKERLSVDESCARLNALVGNDVVGQIRMRAADFGDAGFCRAFALICAVWAGDAADPTFGATLAHRHDEAPAFSAPVKGTALIGPWMFYRPR